jgi:hypothetical protein
LKINCGGARHLASQFIELRVLVLFFQKSYGTSLQVGGLWSLRLLTWGCLFRFQGSGESLQVGLEVEVFCSLSFFVLFFRVLINIDKIIASQDR